MVVLKFKNWVYLSTRFENWVYLSITHSFRGERFDFLVDFASIIASEKAQNRKSICVFDSIFEEDLDSIFLFFASVLLFDFASSRTRLTYIFVLHAYHYEYCTCYIFIISFVLFIILDDNIPIIIVLLLSCSHR